MPVLGVPLNLERAIAPGFSFPNSVWERRPRNSVSRPPRWREKQTRNRVSRRRFPNGVWELGQTEFGNQRKTTSPAVGVTTRHPPPAGSNPPPGPPPPAARPRPAPRLALPTPSPAPPRAGNTNLTQQLNSTGGIDDGLYRLDHGTPPLVLYRKVTVPSIGRLDDLPKLTLLRPLPVPNWQVEFAGRDFLRFDNVVLRVTNLNPEAPMKLCGYGLHPAAKTPPTCRTCCAARCPPPSRLRP